MFDLWKKFVFLSARKATRFGICIGCQMQGHRVVAFTECIAEGNGTTEFRGTAMRWHCVDY